MTTDVFDWFDVQRKISYATYQQKSPTFRNGTAFKQMYVLIPISHKIKFGNPRRFQSRDVVRMEPMQRSVSRPLDRPVEQIETEGERHLQTLLKKQLNTNLSITDHFKQMKEFSSSTKYTPNNEELTGVVTLGDYARAEEVNSYIEEMKAYGLTEEEILYKLQGEDSDTAAGPAKKSRFGADPMHHQASLAAIEEKIQKRQAALSKPDQFSDVRTLSRHEMELERSLIGAGNPSQSLHTMLVKERQPSAQATSTDPMNQLPDILKSITGPETVPDLNQFGRRKRRRLSKMLSEERKARAELAPDTTSLCYCFGPPATEMNYHDVAKVTSHVAMETGHSARLCQRCGRVKDGADTSAQSTSRVLPHLPVEDSSSDTVASCMTKEEYFMVFPGGSGVNQGPGGSGVNQGPGDRVSSQGGASAENAASRGRDVRAEVESIPEDVIRNFKLSVDQIKELPRFSSYSSGEPSSVLYLKNLDSKVTEEDLVSLFIRFQQPDHDRIRFQLMTGKMRGQAFVTFHNEETATKGLELVNGYDFKGKPIIIQYGRKQTK